MRCMKMHGPMVADNLIDMQESSIPMWMKGWRCVSCGNIVDPAHPATSDDPTGGSVALAGNEAASRHGSGHAPQSYGPSSA